MKVKRLALLIAVLAIGGISAIFFLRPWAQRRPYQWTEEDDRLMEAIGKATEKLAGLSPADVERDTTSTWNIYRDTTHHFEIKYPPEWYLQPEGFLLLVEHTRPWGVETSAFGPRIGIWAGDIELPSPDDYLKKYLDDMTFLGEEPKHERTSVKGLQAARIEVQFMVPHETMLCYMIFRDKTVYQITLAPYNPADHKFDGINALFLKIVSTLKITNPDKR